MTHHALTRLGTLGVALALAAGCDSADTTSAPNPAPPSVTNPNPATTPPSAADPIRTPTTAPSSVDPAAGIGGTPAMGGLTGGNPAMPAAANEAMNAANANLVQQVQTIYDQAKAAYDSGNYAVAKPMVDQLVGMKAQLPAEWQTKVDELQKMVASKMGG